MNNEDLWKLERGHLNQKIMALQQQGICYSCHDFATSKVFGKQPLIFDDDRFRVALDLYPRMLGHTIVVYKPHREDISELSREEVGQLFQLCTQIVRALKIALQAEKVYLNTMCDGPINHVHIQLFPRYPGNAIGSKRFVAPRGPLIDGEEVTQRIRSALLPILDK